MCGTWRFKALGVLDKKKGGKGVGKEEKKRRKVSISTTDFEGENGASSVGRFFLGKRTRFSNASML